MKQNFWTLLTLALLALPMMVACGDDDESSSSGGYSPASTGINKHILDSLIRDYGPLYTVSLDEGGTLEYKMSLLNVYLNNIKCLKVVGKINGTDINFLHSTASDASGYVLLDLSECQIVDGGSSYKYTTFEKPRYFPHTVNTRSNVISQGMFWNYPELKYLALPKDVYLIEERAIGYQCKSLCYIVIPASVKTIEENAMLSLPRKKITYISFIKEPMPVPRYNFPEGHYIGSSFLYVPKGTKEKYKNTEYWNCIGNIIEM